MLSTVVIRRQRLSNALRASLTRHQEPLLRGLGERFRPMLGEGEAEVLQSFERLILFFGEVLDLREDEMIASHEAHSAELRDDEEPRERRQQAAEALYQTLVAIRRTAAGHFGSDLATRLLDLDGSTSQEPVTLYRQASRVMERLRNPEVELPESLLGEVPDREGWASRLEPDLARLQAAIEAVEAEDRDQALTRAEKDFALDEHRSDISAIIGSFRAFLRLAGRGDLAEEVPRSRVRPRSRRRAGDEDPEPAGEPTPDAEPEAPQPPAPALDNAPSTGPPESVHARSES